MAFSYYDMVKANTATTGTGSITVGSAVSPYRAFSGVVANGATIRYLIVNGSAWERGYGTYNSGTGVLTRTLECSSTGSLLSLSGASTVENVLGADDINGARYLIAEYTATAASDFQIANWYSTRFDMYELEMRDLIAGTNNSNMQMVVSSDNGSTWQTGANYQNVLMYGSPGDGSYARVSISDGVSYLDMGGAHSSTQPAVMIMRMYDPGGTPYNKFFEWRMLYFGGVSGFFYTMFNGGAWKTSSTYNALKFYFSNSATISAKVRVYGIGK